MSKRFCVHECGLQSPDAGGIGQRDGSTDVFLKGSSTPQNVTIPTRSTSSRPHSVATSWVQVRARSSSWPRMRFRLFGGICGTHTVTTGTRSGTLGQRSWAEAREELFEGSRAFWTVFWTRSWREAAGGEIWTRGRSCRRWSESGPASIWRERDKALWRELDTWWDASRETATIRRSCSAKRERFALRGSQWADSGR